MKIMGNCKVIPMSLSNFYVTVVVWLLYLLHLCSDANSVPILSNCLLCLGISLVYVISCTVLFTVTWQCLIFLIYLDCYLPYIDINCWLATLHTHFLTIHEAKNISYPTAVCWLHWLWNTWMKLTITSMKFS